MVWLTEKGARRLEAALAAWRLAQDELEQRLSVDLVAPARGRGGGPMRDTRLDGRAAWIAAWAALATMTVAYGAPLIVVVGMKPIAAELGTARSGPAAASSLTYIGAAFGGIVAGWLAGRLGIRKVVLFGAAMVAAGLRALLARRPAGRSMPAMAC